MKIGLMPWIPGMTLRRYLLQIISQELYGTEPSGRFRAIF